MSHFRFRGPLPTDSKLFVGRQEAVKQIRELCTAPLRCYIILIGARQTGKTSLLYRLPKELQPYSRSVLVNLQMIPHAVPSELFRHMAIELARQLNLPALLPAARRVGDGYGFEDLLCQVPQTTRPVTVLIDEIRTLPQNTAAYMAHVLRAVFSKRLLSGYEGLERFVFLLAGGSELLNLTVTEVSPFGNIATKIHLPDLTLGETKQLVAHGFRGTQMEATQIHELSEAIHEQTHGHPYLTQRMGAYVAELSEQEEASRGPLEVAKARQWMMENDENLLYVHKALEDPALLDTAYQTVLHPTQFRYLNLRQEKLHMLGIIRNENNRAVPSNPMYAEAIQHVAEGIGLDRDVMRTDAPAPKISVNVLTPMIPTAFCHNLSAEDFPLVRIQVDNRVADSKPFSIYAQANIEGFSDAAVQGLTVPEGGCRDIVLLPVFQFGPCASLNEIRPATLRVTVRQVGRGDGLMYDQTRSVKLHAYDTALLGIHAPEGKVIDLTDYLCAFVTPHAPELEDLLRKAAEHHPLGQISGYQGANTIEEARRSTREQARAIYLALKHDAGLRYVNSPLNFGKQQGQITQRVRLPRTSLHENQSRANCIDGTVLYASLLELATLQPLLVIVPGHAFVGWRVWRDVNQYDFLETTLTAADDFENALKVGKQEYADARSRGYFGRELFDAKGFARLIDVAACRAKQIYPLM